jgi:Domain of unknown function (DUF4157)
MPIAVAVLARAPPAAAQGRARPTLRVVQRECDCGEEAGFSGRCEACNQAVLRPERRAGAAAHDHAIAPELVQDALQQPGEALPSELIATLERQLGHDFSQVRIHTGPIADQSARTIGANAYTVGQDIVFRDGTYRPNTPAGNRLLVHELTHTIQQAGAAPASVLRIGPANDRYERAATENASVLAGAETPAAPARIPAATQLQRDDSSEDKHWYEKAYDAVADTASAAVDWAADKAWDAIKAVLPDSIINIIEAIRSQGILGFLRGKIAPVCGRLFGGLDQGQSGEVGGLLGTFTQLLDSVRTIVGALAKGDCQPLFSAVGKLGDALSQMAGEAWDKIKNFLAPVGDFFKGIWTKFGAPVVDFLSDVAGDVWESIKDFASGIYDAAAKVAGPAWRWLKGVIGIGDDGGGDSQGGILQWIEGKLSDAWDAIKGLVQPIIGPLQDVAAKIESILPIDAILNLRERVHEWLQHAGDMVTNMQSPKGVTANQSALRDRILPAVKAAIVSLGGKIADAGGWVASQIGALVNAATGFFISLKTNTILSVFSGAIEWLDGKVQDLGNWAKQGVAGLFDAAGQAVAKLSTFVDPVLGVLQKLASVIGNVVKALPGLVMGPVWALIPDCIKNPIKDFVIQHILVEIPVIGAFVKLPDIWNKIENLVIDFLQSVFVDGNLGGAALKVVRFVLEACGVDVDLMLRVIGKAIAELDDIMMHPGTFLKNIGAAIMAGFGQFWDHIGANLAAGLQSWLLGPLAKLGVQPMKDLSLGSVFTFVMQVLGITTAKLHDKLVKALGPKVVNYLDTAWHWITTLWDKGPAGVWEEIKTQLSDLGTAIIGGITSWISTDLIKAGIAAIAKMSNPAGAIIELIQTIYTTINFVVTKMNKILAMADSVLNSIGAIAAGNIGAAAGAIEKALVGAIGTVLAFLADWLGFSDPGEKILEIVKKIQLKVDAAIDWLIAKAIALGQKIIGGVKGAVQSAADWLRARVSFSGADGEDHSLYFTGEGKEAKMIVASANPVAVDVFLNQREADAANPSSPLSAEDRTAIGTAVPAARAIIQDIQTNYVYGTPPDPAGAQQAVTAKANELARVIKPIISGATGPVPPMVVSPGFSEAKASGISVHYLFDGDGNHEAGTPPGNQDLSGAWPYLESLGISANWVRFHLLNENTGGKGVSSNLIPAPRDVNKSYLDQFETTMKTAVTSKPVEFSVSVSYYSDDPRFAQRVSTTGSKMKWQAQKWVSDSSSTARLPSFGATIPMPRSDVLRINHMPTDAKDRATLLRGTRFTASMADIVQQNVNKQIRSQQDLIGIMRNYVFTVPRTNDPDREKTLNDFISRIEATNIDYS